MKPIASRFPFLIVTVLAWLPGAARAGSIFVAHLDGAQETPPNISPGSGLGTVTRDDAMTQITVTLDWQDLLAGVKAAQIHKAPTGQAGPIIFSLALGTGAGAIDGSIDPASQSFAITPAQVADLKAGLDYHPESGWSRTQDQGVGGGVVAGPGCCRRPCGAMALGIFPQKRSGILAGAPGFWQTQGFCVSGAGATLS
jgi:hypothetical protein